MGKLFQYCLSVCFIIVFCMFSCPWHLYAGPQEQEKKLGLQHSKPEALGIVPTNEIVFVESISDFWNTLDMKIIYRYEIPNICGGLGKAIIKVTALNVDPGLFNSSSAIIDIQPPKLPPNPFLNYAPFPSPSSYSALRDKWIKSLPYVMLSLNYKGLRPLQSQVEITMNCEAATTGSTPLSTFSINKTWADISNRGDQDGDGLRDEAEDFYANKFAPQVHLEENETCFPSSVDWYLDRITMGFSHTNIPCNADCVIDSTITQNNIAFRTHNGKTKTSTRYWHGLPYVVLCSHDGASFSSSESSKDTFYLEHINGSVKEGLRDPLNNGDIKSAWPVYVHIRSKGNNNPNDDYIIQYWFFYPYNQGYYDFNHEGDWEHITLTLDHKCNVIKALYAQHNGGKYYKDSYPLHDDLLYADADKNHPIMYSAKGTHASYNKPGYYAVPKLSSLGIKDHTSDGKIWHTWEYLINIGEKESPLNGQYFIYYGGLWGRIGDLNALYDHFGIDLSGLATETTGPQGPVFHDEFDNEAFQ